MKITFDNNCLIDLENNRPGAENLRSLISNATSKNIEIFIPAIFASEKTKSGNYDQSFLPFEVRLDNLGFSQCKLIYPIGYTDFTFLDKCTTVSESQLILERRIHTILFPNKSFEFCASFSIKEVEKWKNEKCDVLALWCHINHDCDVFITNDKNFHTEKKKAALIKLGAKSIQRTTDIQNI